MIADTRFKNRPLNGCGACCADFTSTRLFDAHRVGKHAYEFSPDRPDGRRCLATSEMVENGWKQDEKDRWFDPVAVEAARRAFSAAHADSAGTEGGREA